MKDLLLKQSIGMLKQFDLTVQQVKQLHWTYLQSELVNKLSNEEQNIGGTKLHSVAISEFPNQLTRN